MAMQWSEKLALGLPDIDAQHKRLVELIGELEAAVDEDRLFEEQALVLMHLTNYIDEHFRYEEALMAKVAYPDRAEHIISHQRFESLVLEYGNDVARGRALRGRELLDFLTLWLTGHILGTDRDYVAHIQGRGAATSV